MTDCNNFGEKSDILRLEILYQMGGIYVDMDFECLQNMDNLLQMIDNYNTNINLILGMSNTGFCETNNAFIACKQKHSFLKLYLLFIFYLFFEKCYRFVLCVCVCVCVCVCLYIF